MKKTEIQIDSSKMLNSAINKSENYFQDKVTGFLKVMYTFLYVSIIINTLLMIVTFSTFFPHINNNHLFNVVIIFQTILSIAVLFIFKEKPSKSKVLIMIYYIIYYILVIILILSQSNILMSTNIQIIYAIQFLLMIATGTFILLAIYRYLKVSDNVKYYFMKSENTQNNKKRTWSLIKGVILIIFILFNWVYFRNYDDRPGSNTVYYDSIEHLIEQEYEDKEVMYISDDDYYYVIEKRDTNTREQLVIVNNENKYVVYNQYANEFQDAKDFFTVIDIEGFNAYLSITIHEDKCVILLNRYFLQYGRRNCLVFDSIGEFEPIQTFNNRCYFKVIDYSLLDSEYELKVHIGQTEYILVEYDELIWR